MIIGAGGHGKVVADCGVAMGYEDIVFLDDDKQVKTCGKYPVVGAGREFRRIVGEDAIAADFFVAVGDGSIRRKVQREITEAGEMVITLIHPAAVIGNDVEIKLGTVVMAGAVINTGSRIGEGCIINTSSSVDHDCRIGDFVHIAVGVHIAGNVNVGEGTWIGAGATVSNNIEICGGCMIGAGAVVVRDIEVKGTYVGVPARRKGSSNILGP